MRKVITLTFALFLVLLCGLDLDLSSGVPKTATPAPTAVPITPPVPAIDFICSCTVCAGGSGPGCRDLKTHRFTSCASWWASHSSQCR